MPSIVYTIIIIVALLFFGVLVWYVATRNSIKRAEQSVNEAEAALDAAISARHDALAHAAEAVRTYTDTELPVPVTDPEKCTSPEEKEKQAKQLEELAEKLRLILAKHPALSADNAFAALPASEESLKNAIRTYNAGADRLSAKLTHFPSKSVAGRMCLEVRRHFSL